MNPDQVVRDFCTLWSKGDVDGIVNSFTDDAVYHNIPMDPLAGKEAIRGFIQGFVGAMASSIDFDIKHQLVNGNIVMNERVDTIVMNGKTVALPVCGVFEITDDGKIAGWRDYFDAAQFAG